MFVVYSYRDEVLVTTKDKEVEFIKMCQTEYVDDRNLDDYDREEIDDLCVMIEIAGFRIR